MEEEAYRYGFLLLLYRVYAGAYTPCTRGDTVNERQVGLDPGWTPLAGHWLKSWNGHD